MHIAVAGNIGCGKTTLTNMLAKHYGWEPRFESVEYNPYLSDFYADMGRWSFNLQIYFLNKRFKDVVEIGKSDKYIIQDRTIYEDARIFAPNLHDQGFMSDRDFDNYRDLFDLMMSLVKMPDLLIYVRASIPTLVAQIQKRARGRHLKMHADLAMEQGVSKERTFIAHNGAVIELSARKGVMNETVQAGSLMVDGLQNIEDVVLRDRKTLSTDGLVASVILLNAETGKLLAPVEIYSRGFIYMRDNEPLIAEASELVYETAKQFEEKGKGDYSSVKNTVKSRLKSFLYDKTGRTPMILPIVIEI